MTDRLRIIVLGYVVRAPLGGLAWHYLQYVLGLHELGHDVWFLEDSDDYPSCYDPGRDELGTDPTAGLTFLEEFHRDLGLPQRWAYYDAHTDQWMGAGATAVGEVLSSADLLLNISANNPIRPWLRVVPHRAYVDTDPAFMQVRHLTEPDRRALADAHTCWFTFGVNIAAGSADVPDDGYRWQPTRQPVSLAAWPQAQPPAAGAWTCVLNWEAYPPREIDGRTFGSKAASFPAYIDLPTRSPFPMELALGGPTAPRTELRRAGWGLRDPLAVTRDPWTYQRYLAASRGEFGVAKHGYVAGRTGWFSERSAAYLATGRPVVVQDTGFGQWLPTGTAVLTFTSPEEAVDALAEVEADYDRHAGAARGFVAEHFDARRVLTDLIDDVGPRATGPSAPRA